MQKPRRVSEYEQPDQAIAALSRAGMPHGITAEVDFRGVRTDGKGNMFFCTCTAVVKHLEGTPDQQPLSEEVTHNLSRRRTKRMGEHHRVSIIGANVHTNGSTAITFTKDTRFIDEDTEAELDVTPNLFDKMHESVEELVGVGN